MLAAAGCDLDETYFDVPRMRTSTSDGYLTTGIAFAFHPHRDTWYSAPMCQVNWWIPIYEVEGENAMAFHPQHWDRQCPNDSWVYDYQEWNARSRFNAADQIGRDVRRQPVPLVEVEAEPRIVVVTPPGGMLLFSAAQLHSSIPNRSGVTRLSIDFRVVNASDAASLAGAPNVDSYCTGSAIDDYLRGSDLSHLRPEVQALYSKGHPQPPLHPPLRAGGAPAPSA
jgi:ectoine hydroxylase-related dioxygenase (phytanoyl-CoA dioxygenase family)